MRSRVLVLGAGFAGLELAAVLSEELGEDAGVTLIDASDAFAFGYSKLDVLFARAEPEALRLPYAGLAKPGVRFVRETVTAIDPEARRVTTDGGSYETDVLVVALGAALDLEATPGVAEAGEFYSFAGAVRARERLAAFAGGHAVIGVCGTPYKCPPAPSEAALLLGEHLATRGLRQASRITLVIPFATPVPPSPDASAALLAAFSEQEIEFVPGRAVAAVDPAAGVASLDDGSELPFDLFLGVPRHRAPAVVLESGLADDGFVPADPKTLATRFRGVYAVGDVTTLGAVPKAGVLAERAGRVVAERVIAEQRGSAPPPAYDGRGSCYVEFGAGRVARVDVDFLSGPAPSASFEGPSAELVADKRRFGAARRARWFGR